MTDKTVTLRLATDAKGVAPGVKEANAQMDSLGAGGKRAGQSIADGMRKADDQVQRVGKSSGVAAGMVSRLFAAAAGAQALRSATALADEYTNITGRLKLAANSQAEFTKSQAETFAISQRTSTALESTVALYTRLSKATQEYGVSQARNLAITETINKTFAISGASADAQKNAITQLTQALAGGVLRAEEFNSIIENSPRLAQALADGMGISMGQLRQHVNDGQVSVERMVQALEGQASAIQREFEQMPLTVERALVQLRNSVTLFVGEASTEFGATGALAQGISFLADNLAALDKAVGVVAIAFGSRLVAGLVSATAAKIASAVATRQAALAEVEAARQAEAAAAARLSAARAGLGAAGSLVIAEQQLAAATARSSAAMQAASVAATAKAASMRVLNGAMAAFGGPVGLAVTALSLFVAWAMNSSAKAKELAESVRVGFQPAIDQLEKFSEATANADFAGLDEQRDQMQKTADQVEALSDKYQQLRDARMRAVAQDFPTDGYDRQLEETNRAIEQARIKQDALTAGYERAIDISADLILQKAGISNATDDERRKLEELVNEQVKQRTSLEVAKPEFVKFVASIRDVTAANTLNAASFKDVAAAAASAGNEVATASQKVAAGLNQQVNQLQLQMIEATQGKAAALRAGFIKQLADAGIDPTSADAQALRALNEQKIAATLANDRLAKSATAATRAQAQHTKAVDQAKESQARYTAEAALATAEQQGPLALAQEQNRQRIAELDKALKAHNITQASYTTLVEASKVALTKRQAELDRDIGAPQALLDAMTGELTILRQTGIQREISRRQLQAEQDMRRELATAIEAAGSKEQLATKMGAKNYREYEAAMLSAADASAAMSVAIEQSARDAEDWAAVWGDAVSSVADAFTDFVMSGLKDFSGLARDLKSISKQLVGDLVRTFLQQKIVIPIQTQITSAASGGNWLQQLAGLVTGGRGLTGTGAMAAQSSWGAGIAAGAGASMGFGNNIDSLMQMAGAGSGLGGGTGGSLLGGLGGNAGMLYKVANWISGGKLSGLMTGAKAGASKLLGSAGGMWGSAALGALYGWQQGGDTVGKGLGAAAYGTAGYAAAAAGSAALAGGSALAAIPVAGWVALAAIAVDKISGGKLFGSKYKTKETGQTIDIGADGGSVSAYAYQEGQKSLFRGKKRRTVDIEASEESKEAAQALYKMIAQTARNASDALGLASVEIIQGSFKAVYDAKGNLKSELSTVLGRTFNESFEDFQQRLQAENIIAQVGQLDDTASTIAERWRSSAAKLNDGAQFLLAAAADFNDGAGLLTVGGLSRLTDLIEKLQTADETLTQAYQRVMSNASSYGETAAAAYQEVATAGFSSFAKSLMQVRQEETERIRTLQAQAKALGGLSAREEDLAKVRESAQLKTDALVTALQGELVDLALNRLNDQIQQLGGATEGTASKIEAFINSLRMSDTLSPDTDAQRRVTANDLMSAAALAGDVDAFTQYAQQFLEVSRSLNASAAGYQADYDRVMQMAKQFGAEGNAASLEQLYAQRSALQAQQEAAARLERAQRIAQGVSDLAGVNGANPLDILRSVTGMTGKDLAADLGLSEGQLDDYLAQQQTDIGDLVDVMYELPKLIATEMINALADKTLGAPSGGQAPATSGPSRTTTGEDKLLDTLGELNKTLARQQVLDELKLHEEKK